MENGSRRQAINRMDFPRFGFKRCTSVGQPRRKLYERSTLATRR